MPIDMSHAIALIEQSHQENLSSAQPAHLYEPRNYIMSQEGKRMRSIFCLMGYSLYQPNIEQACDLAYAIELFHNFTLVHDDIMDDADLRRGNPSVHAEYGVNNAILTGDVMLIEVYDRLLDIESPYKLDMVRVFSETAKKVCEGQSMDMTFEEREDVSIADYLEMIENKTAILLGTALRLGAMLGQSSEKDQDHLYKFGINAGISFQLQDDYLDVYGDAATFGKKVGGDILQCKKTYLYLRALELLDDDDKIQFIKLYVQGDLREEDKITRVTNIFNELYLSNYCHEAKQAFFDLAVSHLDQVAISKDDKESLIAFARQFIDRKS